MKILYFHQYFSTPEGATGTRSYEMARKLLEKGHAVTMVCGTYGMAATGLDGPYERGFRRGMVDGIDVLEFDLAYSNSDGFFRRSLTFMAFAFRSVGLVFSESYDVVFATSTPLTAGIPGIFARWLRGKPFVFEVRDLWPELPRAMGVIRNPAVLWAMSLLEWVSYRSASRLIGLSPGIVDGIIRSGVAGDRIAMVPNGCDIDFFSSGRDAWRPDGVASSDLLAVFSGTHGIANGLDAVLDAAAELQRRGRPDVKIVLIGEGKLKGALRRRAKTEGLDNVLFLDAVGKARLAGLLAGSDVGLQLLADIPAFYYGTSPNKFFDYLAAGLPVLNNYPGWVADMVREHGCGFAVPPRDPCSFADALLEAAEDRAHLRVMGANARKLAEKAFSRSMLAERWTEWVTGA